MSKLKINFTLSKTPYRIVVELVSLSKAMTGLDEGTIKAVWPHLTEDEKSTYLKDTPDSKMHEILKKEALDSQDGTGPTTGVHEDNLPARDKPKAEPLQDTDGDEEPADEEDTEPKTKPIKKKKKSADLDEDDEDESPKSKSANWWDLMDSDEQDAYLQRHPGSKRRKTNVKGITKSVLKLGSNAVHKKVSALGKNYRWGMKGIRALRAGKPLTPGHKEGMKKTAGVIAGMALLALGGLALFTPLGGMAMDLGEEYIKHLNSKGEASSYVSESEGAEDDELDRKTLDELHKGFTEWLMAQDPKELASKIKAGKNGAKESQ